MKYVFKVLFTTSIFISSLLSVDIELNGTQTLLSGTDCSIAKYRFGTNANYNNKGLDIILEVLSEDNDYRGGSCIGIQNNVISFHLRDTDQNENVAYMDVKITIVEKDTLTPVITDQIAITNFDLDNSPNYTGTDDVYYKDTSNTYLSSQSNIVLSTGSFHNQYTTKLKGQNSGNCSDSATLTTLECRGAALWEKKSTIYARVQNDNAYGTQSTRNKTAHRLIQFSFEYKDIAPLLNKDYGDAPLSYGTPSHAISDLYLGASIDKDINSYHSNNAMGDDTTEEDDEDGVTLNNGDALDGAFLALDSSHTLKITASNAGHLNAWIDFNIDGDFDDVGEQIFDAKALSAGENSLAFNISDNLTTKKETYIRFRFSSNSNLNNTQIANDGEVEDYMIKFGSDSIRGTFNIERTNSQEHQINTNDRNAWYTQIVGRDFDYSLVFYKEDFSAEQKMPEMNLKIELIDEDSNTTLYTRYAHVLKESKSIRIDVTNPADDLAALLATKKAIFRITYAINPDDSIKEDTCSNDYKACLEAQPLTRTNYAKDNFSIRPESFYISIADKNTERTNSRTPNAKLTMAAGYDYNLTVKATKYKSTDASKGYTKRIDSSFPFNKNSMTAWNDTSDIKESIQFENGIFTNPDFHHDNVGKYTLSIPDDTSWTKVDQENGDCKVGEATSSKTPNEKSGCNIKQARFPIALTYYPDHFEVVVTLTNLPSSGHDGFIYMNSLSADKNVAIAFNGTITAKSENNVTTTNFIAGCMATELVLDLNASQVSTSGTDTQIVATDGKKNVNFSRFVRFNNQGEYSKENNLVKISNNLTIAQNNFLPVNKGSISLDMRYNLNKYLNAPVNPIQVTFNTLSTSSVPASSMSHDKLNPMHIPTGSTTFVNNLKQFYYAKVVSDRQRYPQVNTNLNPTVVTPLNVDIYCLSNIINYCTDRDIHLNGNSEGTTRDQNGWFISRHHRGDLDGSVTSLVKNNNILSIAPAEGNNINITIPNGHNPSPSAIFTSCAPIDNSIVTIGTSPALAVNPDSSYEVSCTQNQPSSWAGTGETGHTISTTPNIDKNNKIHW